LGIAAVAIAIRSDLGFQLASGPSLFLAGYIAADRRRVALPEPYTVLFGLAAGVATMVLRWYGEGVQAAWQGLLLTSIIVTAVLRIQGFLRGRAAIGPRQIRTLPVESGDRPRQPAWAPTRSEARQPVMAASPVGMGYSPRSTVSPRPTSRSFDAHGDPNDLVRQMRRTANRGGLAWLNTPLLLAALLIFNPVGLWLTWTARTMGQTTKVMLTAVSVLWYLGVAGLGFALTHR